MSYEGVIDPASAAAIASTALQQALAALQQVMTQAKGASAAASAAAAAQAAVAAMLKAVGVAYRWNGTVLQLRLPDGTWGPGADLEGPPGGVGPVPRIRIGTVSQGDFAVEIPAGSDPAAPVLNFTLQPGAAAWTPLFGIVVDGARCVFKLVDWTGGGGSKPAAGLYLGSAGLTADITRATDVRGLMGAGNVTADGTPVAGHLAVFGSTAGLIGDGGALTPFGASVVALASKSDLKALLALVTADVSGAAPLASPAFTGTPTAPTPSAGDASSKVATTSYADAAVAAIVGMAPAQLNTLQEIAAQLATDENTAAALASTVAGKLAKASNLSDLADSAQARGNLGLRIGADVQAWDTDLDAIAALSTKAFGRSLLTLNDSAALNNLITVGGAPSAANPQAAAYTVQTSDKGKVLRLTGTFTLTGPAAAPGFYFWISKRDGNGVVTFTPSSGTIDGLPSISIYQEGFLVWCDGTNWWTQNRPKGWINIGQTVVSTAIASITFTTGFADPELRDMAFDWANLGLAAAAQFCAQVTKGGSLQSSAYYETAIFFSASTSYTRTPSVSQISLTTNNNADNNSGEITLFGFGASAYRNQRIAFRTQSAGQEGSLGEGGIAVAGAMQALTLFANGQNITSITANQKAFRP